MTRRFVVQEKFGLWCEHLDYQHSIIPQGQFLMRREMRRFKAYFLNFPLFEKVVTSTASCPRSDEGGGGIAPTQHIRTEYKLWGKTLFVTNSKKPIYHPFHFYYHYYRKDSPDFWDTGKYISNNKNINEEIFTLCKDLSAENQNWLLRHCARMKKCFEEKIVNFVDLDNNEIKEMERICTEFLPNIHKLSDSLFAYQGYFLPVNHFEVGIFWHKYCLNILEPQTLAKMRQKDFIDAGGFIGDSAILFEREFCDKNIYTFEPVSTTYENMLKTLKLNNSKRVIPINKGLGKENKEIQIGVSDRDGIGSSIVFCDYKGTQGMQTIQITTLDDFVREHNLEVGFIKVDIEGAEQQFLAGAKETICTQKPTLLICIYHQPSDFFKIKPLIESWGLGYKFKIVKKSDFSLWEDTLLFCEILD